MKEIFKLITKSILAGVLIALAGITYLNCDNKIIGAFLFSFGLIGVFICQGNLYTGKVGYINSKRSVLDLLVILAVNLVAAFLVGLIYRFAIGTSSAFDSRMTKSLLRLFTDGVGCGILIYLSCEFWKATKNVIPVIICVMAFILAGFEHSVADMFYYATGTLSIEGLMRILVIIFGNAIGSILIRLLQRGWKDELPKNI